MGLVLLVSAGVAILYTVYLIIEFENQWWVGSLVRLKFLDALGEGMDHNNYFYVRIVGS